MTYQVSSLTDTAFLAFVQANLDTYIDLVATSSGKSMPHLRSAEIGGSGFALKARQKPFLILEPESDEINDELPGNVETILNYGVLICSSGTAEDEAITISRLYKDAFVSMILSNNTLGGAVTHITVRNVQHYPGGVVTDRYAMLAVEITVDQRRD